MTKSIPILQHKSTYINDHDILTFLNQYYVESDKIHYNATRTLTQELIICQYEICKISNQRTGQV